MVFIDSFMDDVTYIRDIEDCVERMICYITGCICYGSENYGLGSVHDDCVGLAGTTPHFYSVAPCTRVGTLIVATIYLQLIQNRYMFGSFTVLQCSHQHCVQPVASDVEVVGYL